LLFITYDEHGGCCDDVEPSAAVPPEPPVPGQTFGFNRYGVHVQAVIVSPYVAPGTILPLKISPTLACAWGNRGTIAFSTLRADRLSQVS
jgi:Phosphoesterase family